VAVTESWGVNQTLNCSGIVRGSRCQVSGVEKRRADDGSRRQSPLRRLKPDMGIFVNITGARQCVDMCPGGPKDRFGLAWRLGAPPVERVGRGHDVELAATGLRRAAMRHRCRRRATARMCTWICGQVPYAKKAIGRTKVLNMISCARLSPYRQSTSEPRDAIASQELKC